MLKDRRVLLEQEIDKLKKECGEMYLALARGYSTNDVPYFNAKELLSDRMSDLVIVNQLIADGHE